MMKSCKQSLLGAVLGASAMVAFPVHDASASEAGLEVGVLSCETVPGTRFNLLIRSSVDVTCVFKGSDGKVEKYRGETGIALGVDLNVNRQENIAFTVLSATQGVSPGDYALSGKYVGGKASATVGVGLGAAVLVGGGDKSFSLQPIAVEGSTGLGVSGGIGYLYIEPAAR